MDNDNKQVILLLGVSRSLGRAVAYKYLRNNCRVIIVSRNEEKLKTIKSELESYGDIHYIPWDLSSEKDHDALIRKCIQEWGRIDHTVILVGGYAGDSPADPSSLDQMLENHVRIPAKIIQSLSRFLNAGSSIVMISSIQVNSRPNTASYSYTIGKTALNKIVEMSAVFFHKKGVRVNGIAPYQIMDSFVPEREWRELRKFGDSMTPPEDIAEVIFWLTSPSSDWVDGVIIPVDGGARLLS